MRPPLRHAPLLLACFLVARPALAADPIGSESCRACHPRAWEIWKDSPHSRATASLSARQQKDARCLSCHSPDASKGVPEVSCETCHGGGQFYSPRYVMKDAELARAVGLLDPTERLCLKCHDSNAPSLRPFSFEEKLQRIDHWSEGRAARQAQKAAGRGHPRGEARP
jgi:formate-dependent nitrite reductase cytochrome c552 subunit